MPNLKQSLLLACLVGALASTQAHADPLDSQLKNRDTMVAAVAILLRLPPNCTVDNKPPDFDMVARFIFSYGHEVDDAFMADVKAKIKRNEEGFVKLDPSEQASVANVICGYGVVLTYKVRDVERHR